MTDEDSGLQRCIAIAAEEATVHWASEVKRAERQKAGDALMAASVEAETRQAEALERIAAMLTTIAVLLKQALQDESQADEEAGR